MRLAIMQPYIFPYIGYYQLVKAVDKFVIYDDVNYINKGWINRNSILVNNQSHMFTIPLRDASQNRLIREIEILSDVSWKKKFLKTIDQAYKKAPYFDDFFELVSDIINTGITHINELAYLSISAIASYLGISTRFVASSSFYNNAHLKGQNRILDICLIEKADHYINPIGGMEIYTNELFQQENIKLNFIKSEVLPYKQYNDEFVPSLSIIDILMFNSRDAVNKLLDEYVLI
jgi:WbqC-like protein family